MNIPLTDHAWFPLTAVAALLALGAASPPAPLKVGDPFPDLSAQHLEGKLPDSLKGKVMLVDFWASWCAPCAKSFPIMEELYSRYKDRGVVVVAISVDETAAAMQTFLKKHPVTFIVLRDAEQRLVSRVDADAMPASFILDGDGKVRFLHNGFHGTTTKDQYASEIESLLKGTP